MTEFQIPKIQILVLKTELFVPKKLLLLPKIFFKTFFLDIMKFFKYDYM